MVNLSGDGEVMEITNEKPNSPVACSVQIVLNSNSVKLYDSQNGCLNNKGRK